MTSTTAQPSPPPPPLGYSQGSRPTRLREAIIWIVILSCVALFIWESQAASRWSSVGDPTKAPAGPPVQLTLQGRYIFGLQQNLSKLGPGFPPDQVVRAVEEMDKSLKRPADRLRLVPVIAEVQGAAAARERLALLRDQLTTPSSKEDAQTLDEIYQSGSTEIPQADREGLIANEGWFGDLALTWQHPAGAPDRDLVVRAATRTMIALGLLVLVILGAMLVGLALLIIGVTKVAGGTIRPKYVPPPGLFPRYLEAFALYLLAMIALSLIVHLLKWRGLWPSFALLLLPPLTLAWPAWKYGERWTARCVGWIGGVRVLQEMGLGIVGYLAGLPVVAVGFGVSMLIAKLVGAQPTHPVEQFASGSPAVIVQLFLLASVVAPLVEETMFRGAFYHYLRGRFGWFFSATVVGLIFAAVHPQGWTTIPALGAIGFVLATIREWRSSLVASMTAHALNNAVVCTFLVLATSMI